MKEGKGKAPLVTVLMPVYNGEKYLREAIDSILDQTFVNFEFLIINDGSHDASESIILSYSDSRIKMVNNETNLGLIATLNKGIRLARGEYIARMDQDDISVPQRLEKQVMFMDSHLEVGVCGGWINVFGSAETHVQKYPADSDEIKALLFFYCALAHPSVMMRRRVFLENNLSYDPEFKHAEDYGLWTVISGIANFANLQEVLLNYRITDQQVSAVNRAQQIKSSLKAMEIHLGRLGILPTAKERMLHRYLILNDRSMPVPELKDIKMWVAKIINLNRQKHVYVAPFFPDLLKRKWFLVVLDYVKNHRSNLSIDLIRSACFMWLVRSFITRKKIIKYL